jgi:hypothetical protein
MALIASATTSTPARSAGRVGPPDGDGGIGTRDAGASSQCGPWAETAILFADDGAPDDGFGAALAFSVNVAVVGAPRKTFGGISMGTGYEKGVVYIYLRSASGWELQQELVAPAPDYHFGQSVSLSDGTLVVSSGTTNYIFTEANGTWSLQQKLTADVGVSFAEASISGNTVLVKGNPTPYIFVRSGSTWTVEQRLAASDVNVAAGDWYGSPLALSGDTALVAASGQNQERGAVYVFGRSGGMWTMHQKLVAGDGVALDHFGYTLAISGDTAIVGANGGRGQAGGRGDGSAYVFVRSGSAWTFRQKLVSGGGSDAYFGSFSISGARMMISMPAPTAYGAEIGLGAAFVFVDAGGDLVLEQKILPSDGLLGDGFGDPVAIDKQTALVASHRNGQGAVYVEDYFPGAGGPCGADAGADAP